MPPKVFFLISIYSSFPKIINLEIAKHNWTFFLTTFIVFFFLESNTLAKF